jgi:uncharacterized membrane protein
VALAYEVRGAFVSQGWWKIAPNACQTVEITFDGGALYYRAESAAYRKGRETLHHNWGNQRQLFVANKEFRFDNAERSRRSARPAMFGKADIPESQRSKPITTMTVRFREDATTTEVKTGLTR